MKKLYTLKDLKKKYDPDKVIVQIEENFVLHKYTLINLLSIDSCPLSNYKQERQLSFLETKGQDDAELIKDCLLYTSPSPRDLSTSRMPSSA